MTERGTDRHLPARTQSFAPAHRNVHGFGQRGNIALVFEARHSFRLPDTRTSFGRKPRRFANSVQEIRDRPSPRRFFAERTPRGLCAHEGETLNSPHRKKPPFPAFESPLQRKCPRAFRTRAPILLALHLADTAVSRPPNPPDHQGDAPRKDERRAQAPLR